MAKLKVLPELAIIDGLKGKIDYYMNFQSSDPETRGKGIPCARKWPRSPGHKRAPGAFSYAASHWATLPKEIQDPYNKMASGTGLSGRDMFTRGYLTGLYRYELPSEEEMITYWLADPVALFEASPQNATVGWTEADLSAHLPAASAFAILELVAAKTTEAGAARLFYKVRKKDAVWSHYPFLSWWSAVAQGQDMHLFPTCPVDANRKIEWSLDNAPGCQFYLWLYLWGYIK